MPQAVIGRWGESLAVRVPGDIAKAAGLGDGQKVEILAESNVVVIRGLSTDTTVEGMFAGRSPRAGGTYTPMLTIGAPIAGASCPRTDA